MASLGSIDISEILKQGVYLLSRENVIVYVGQSKCMLVRIYTHRSLARRRVPSWLPIRGVVFDKVEVIPCHPDRINALEKALIELHTPVYNKAMNPDPSEYPVPCLHVPRPVPSFRQRL